MKPTRRLKGLEPLAQAARQVLGSAGFVLRDRQAQALFVSDYPRRCDASQAQQLQAALESAGFVVAEEGGLARMDAGFTACQAFLDGMQPLALHQLPQKLAGLVRILQQHRTSFTPAMLPLARQALLLWDQGQMDALVDLASAQLALSLRSKQPVPAFLELLLRCPTKRREETHAD